MVRTGLATRAKHAVQNRLAQRYHLRGEIDRMDAVGDPTAIARALGTQEFPWGITQALSFALFRTYAVPSIGDLLYKTSQFTESTQKRYDDTVLLLDAPIEHGVDSPAGRAGIRRIIDLEAEVDALRQQLSEVKGRTPRCGTRYPSGAPRWQRLPRRWPPCRPAPTWCPTPPAPRWCAGVAGPGEATLPPALSLRLSRASATAGALPPAQPS